MFKVTAVDIKEESKQRTYSIKRPKGSKWFWYLVVKLYVNANDPPNGLTILGTAQECKHIMVIKYAIK